MTVDLDPSIGLNPIALNVLRVRKLMKKKITSVLSCPKTV